MARRIGRIVAVLAFLAGTVFALQGLRLLPSAVMYGRPEWVAIGGAMMLVSIGTLIGRARR